MNQPRSPQPRPSRLTCLIAVLCALCVGLGTPLASAAPVFVVHGVATDADGAPLDGWTVVVTNETTHWRATTVVGETTSGVYQVSRIDLTGHAAQVGDTIRADLIGAQGATHASHLREVTDADLSSASIAFDFTLVDPAADPIQTALRAAWLFDDADGVSARDASGRDNEGFLVGATEWVAGKFGTAVDLSGGAHMLAVNGPDLQLTETDFTLCIWINYAGDASAPNAFMSADDEPGGDPEWTWLYDGDRSAFSINDETRRPTNLLSEPWTPTVGQWTHLAVVREGVQYTHYLNGAQIGREGETRRIGEGTRQPFLVGGAEGGLFFDGLIDDAAVFGRALSQGEVGTIMREGLGQHVPVPDPTPGAPGLRALVVYGDARDANGVLPDGWTVTVTNVTRGWEVESTVGARVSGVYEVTQVDLTDPVAAIGDTVNVEISHPDGEPTFLTEHVVGVADLDQATLRADVEIPPDLIGGPPPTVTITDIVSAPRQDVVIHYELASETKRTLSLEVEFSTDGGATWSPATVTGRTEAITPARYGGSLTWGSVAALPPSTVPVIVRLTPGDFHGAGTPAVSHEFSVTNVHLPTDELATLEHHRVWSVAFSPDGKTLASGSDDTTVKLWDIESLQQIAVSHGPSREVMSVAFSPDGLTLARATVGQAVRLWDVDARHEIGVLQGHTSNVTSVAFSPDGRTLASGSYDTTVKLWDARARQEIATLEGQAHQVYSVAFSPDGTTLASGNGDHTVKLWDVHSRQEIATLQGHSNTVMSVAFSPDGVTLASGSVDNTVKLWNVDSLQEIATLSEHPGGVWSVAFSTDGVTLASGGGHTVKLWHIDARQEIATLEGHSDQVTSVAFSPNGATLASGSWDSTVRLWSSPMVADNNLPTIAVAHSAIVTDEDGSSGLSVSATDPDGDPLRFSATGLPDNASLDPTSGEFTFMPDHTQSGEYTVEFTVSDGRLGTDSVTVEITVANVDLFRIRSGPRRVSEGETLTLSLAANGGLPDDAELTATGLPDNGAFDADTRTLSFSPDRTQAGKYDVVFRATRGGELAEEHPVTLTVEESPAFALSPVDPQEINEGQEASFVAAKVDDASGVALSASGLPLNATFDAESGALSFTPDYTQAGDYTITVEATEAGEVVQSESLSIAVTDQDVFSLTPGATHEVAEGGSVDVTAALAEGVQDTVSLAADNLPPNATFDASTGVLTFAPDYAQAGVLTIGVDALQRGQVFQTEVVTITVTETPVFALSPGANNEVGEGATLTVTVVLDDPSGDSISLTAGGLPPNATFDASTGVLTFAPDYAQAGDVTISIDALQREQVVQTEVVTITVAETSVFALSPGLDNEVGEGATLTVTAVLDDPSRASISLTADGLPPNATFDADAGRLTFAPDYSQAGDYAVTIVASERGQEVQSAEVAFVVTETPVFALTPADGQRILEGQSATTQAEVIASAVGDVALSALDLPANATFDVGSGALLFAPDYTQAGDYELTVVATQNGVRVGSLVAAVTVVNVPTFALSPEDGATLDEGAEVTAQLVAIDGVGDDVSFDAPDLPRNATYADGTLRFAPDFSQQGTHTVTFGAVQDGQTVDSESVTFTVRNVDVLGITPDAPYTVDEGSTVSISVVVVPQAAGEVTVTAADLPPKAEFATSAGVLTFAPDHSQAGQHVLTIRASQDGVTVEEERLTVTVVDVNVAPTVTLSPAPATAAGDIRIAYEIADFDDDPVSLEVEYSNGAWASASVVETVVEPTDYAGAIVWRSRDDIPSTGGVDVRLRVTPSDAGQGDAVTTDVIRLVNLLGDYNDDRTVGFDDLVNFTLAWRTQDASRDIGPTTGDTPDLAPRPDGVVDFEDLTTFVRMWNWSADQALLAVGAAMAPTALSDALAYRVRPTDGDWSVQRVDLVDPFDTESAAARLTVSYDPESVAIRVRDERDPSAVLLTRLDASKGVLEVQMAWLDSRSGPAAMLGLDVTALRPGDAEARVAFDFRDGQGNSRRGVELLQLRFEPPPTTTRLLPNYPNPFNPETWIPFELAEAADVAVTIYDASGAAVRTLSLGRLAAGTYHDRATAAHWDGRDANGELVGSGVYVLELRAGDGREMRRLVLLK